MRNCFLVCANLTCFSLPKRTSLPQWLIKLILVSLKLSLLAELVVSFMKNFMHSIRSLHYFNRQQKFLLKNFFPETKRYCLMPLTKKELINPNTKFDFQILLHNGFSWTIKNTELHNSKIKVLFLSLIIGDFSYLKYLSFLYINSSKLKKLHTRMNQETAFSKGRTVLCSNSVKFSEGPLK